MSGRIKLFSGSTRDLGGFSVTRLLPQAQLRHVGPFVFLDEMGPKVFAPGQGIDVRPHPHIGLATVTYLFEGTIGHRDSLGTVQDIEPGACNWMTAGHGISHSERTPPKLRSNGHRLHGMQAWVALPSDQAECEPRFDHVPAHLLPTQESPDMRLRLIVGAWDHLKSPIRFAHPILYVHASLAAGARIDLSMRADQLAVVSVSGDLELCGTAVPKGQVAVLANAGEGRASAAPLVAHTAAEVMILGGQPYPEPRYLDWNFVAISRARLAQARQDWRDAAARGWKGTAFTLPPGEDSFIPLPGEGD